MPRKIMFVLCLRPTDKADDHDDGISYTNNEESNEDAKNSSNAVRRATHATKASPEKKTHQTIKEKVSAWRKNWNFDGFVPPYFTPSLFYSPHAFTLEPMDEIRVLFDRNDKIMPAVTCDYRSYAETLEKRIMFLSYKLINTSTMTSVRVEQGTCLATLLEANMIASTLVPVDEPIKYNPNDEEEEDDEYIPYWLQA